MIVRAKFRRTCARIKDEIRRTSETSFSFLLHSTVNILIYTNSKPRRGYFFIRDSWRCAAGCGRIFTTGLTKMRSHFQSIESLEWGCTCLDFLALDSSSYLRLANVPECLYCRWKVKCSSFNQKNGSIHTNRKWVSWDRENYILTQKWQRSGLGFWKASGTYQAKINPSTPLPPPPSPGY